MFSPLSSLVAFDISDGMLEQARGRGCYTAFVQGCCPDLSAVAHAAPFDIVFCAGTFTRNHAPASTLDRFSIYTGCWARRHTDVLILPLPFTFTYVHYVHKTLRHGSAGS